jgi:flagellar protein FliO/FliZ
MLLALAQAVTPIADPAPISGQAVLTMLAVLGLLGLLAWALRRGTGLARSRAKVVVETAVPLGDRRSLVIVEVENRRLLLGLTPSQISLVTELGPAFAGDLATALEEAPTP